MRALLGYGIGDDDEYDLGDDGGYEENVLTDTQEPDEAVETEDDSDSEEIEDGDEPPDLVEALASESHEWETDDELQEEEEF